MFAKASNFLGVNKARIISNFMLRSYFKINDRYEGQLFRIESISRSVILKEYNLTVMRSCTRK